MNNLVENKEILIMKYVSPICEMDKVETVDIMESSMGGIVPGAMFDGQTEAIDQKNTTVTTHDDGTKDVSVGIDFNKLGVTQG